MVVQSDCETVRCVTCGKTTILTALGFPKPKGAWVEVTSGDVDHPDKTAFRIWLEYDPEYDRFLGTVTIGSLHNHLEAFRYTVNEKDEWHVNDDRADEFLGQMCDGNRPQTLEIEGFSGEWLLIISPYC